MNVDCDAGDDLAQAIRRAEILAGRFAPVTHPLLRGQNPRLHSPIALPRPIEVNISGTCVTNLRVTTSDLTLRGVTEGAAIVAREGDCDVRPGAAIQTCPAVGVVNATGVLIANLSIVQNGRGTSSGAERDGVSAVRSQVRIRQCHIETMGESGLRTDDSIVEVTYGSIVGNDEFAVYALGGQVSLT